MNEKRNGGGLLARAGEPGESAEPGESGRVQGEKCKVKSAKCGGMPVEVRGSWRLAESACPGFPSRFPFALFILHFSLCTDRINGVQARGEANEARTADPTSDVTLENLDLQLRAHHSHDLSEPEADVKAQQFL